MTVQSGGQITGADRVDLGATDDDDARVTVLWSITATGAVAISAEAGRTVALSALTSHTGTSMAKAEVRDGAAITAATLSLTARNSVSISNDVADAVLGDSTVSQTNVTWAGISGGAHVTLGSGPISGSQAASVLIEAVDETSIVVDIAGADVALLTDFATLASSITLSRDTRAFVSGAPASGNTLDAGGRARVHAENRGTVRADIGSAFVGVVENDATDEARAYLDGASAAPRPKPRCSPSSKARWPAACRSR
jgi:hypothetical protein